MSRINWRELDVVEKSRSYECINYECGCIDMNGNGELEKSIVNMNLCYNAYNNLYAKIFCILSLFFEIYK